MSRLPRAVVVLAVLSLTGALEGRASATERIGVAGVSVALPSGWHAIPESAQPSQNDPVSRIVASSGPIWFGGGCNDLDYAFPRTAVAIVLVEWVQRTPGARFAPRPRRFTPKTLPVLPSPALECFNGPGGAIQFSDHGRRFAAYVLLGRRAPAALSARARAVLDTLTVKRRP
jgi:hypothetical protein